MGISSPSVMKFGHNTRDSMLSMLSRTENPESLPQLGLNRYWEVSPGQQTNKQTDGQITIARILSRVKSRKDTKTKQAM